MIPRPGAPSGTCVTPLRVGALILAAGEGRRMGLPKALLPLEGRTFLDVLLERLSLAGAAPIIVVLGSAAPEIRSRVEMGSARVTVNPDPDRGQLSSVHCGLDALLPGEVDALFIAPVDTPRVRVETLLRMRESLPGRPLVVPACRGRRGHPALFSASLFPALRAAPLDQGARAVVHAARDRLEMETDDSTVLVDFDRPEDLQRL
jgi:CTP:molybdopterin cytidylyltransferase MocA